MATYNSLGQALDEIVKELTTKAQKLKTAGFSVSGTTGIGTASLDLDYKDTSNFKTKLQQALIATLTEVSDDLKGKLDASIVSYNLVETGNLKNSLIIDTSDNSIKISYDAPYAALMHYGGYIIPYGNPNTQPVYIAPRPWIEVVLAVYDLSEIFYRNFDY